MADNRIVRKLVDRRDIIRDIDRNITPNYFPNEVIDKSRVSVYGWLTEALAISFEDTFTLEQRRAMDYCPELSPSEIHVNQTAKLRGVPVDRAVPGECYAMLGILKSDILAKGTPVNDEIQFVIDRRSTILYAGINYSLEDDILIRAVKRGTGYLYAANYTGEHSSYKSYLQTFEFINTQGEEMVKMIAQVYQCRYNVSEKHVTDLIEFTYEGKGFDYKDQLADFEVYYKKSLSDEYRKVATDHYLTQAASKALYYNDDESGLLRIMNNPALGLSVNSVIRVEIKETLGTEGNITINDANNVTFQMYRDAAYAYAGVHVWVTMLSDTVHGSNGDTLTETKKRLIDEKTRRDNITTEHDIITYINDIDANVQLVKKRNDIQDRNYFMYVLMRYNDPELGDRRIAPTTTKRLNLNGIKNVQNWGDFDRYDATVGRKIVRAYSKFKLHVVEGEPDQDYVTRCPNDECDPDTYYLTCPYMILINDLNIAYYYFTSVDETVTLSMKLANNFFPYQMITRGIHILRDSHNPDEHDIYRFTVKAALNTENDSLLVDKNNNIIDPTKVMCHLFIPLDGSPNAYLPMKISGYIPRTREFIFTGSCRTTDYITELDKLEMDNGLKAIGTNKNYNSVVDYKDASFQVSFMFKKDDPENLYGRSDSVYSMLPAEYTEGYVLMNSYYNNPANLYNLILEFSKFSRSPCQLTRRSETVYDFSIGAVPFFEYEFGTKWTAKLFPTFKRMTIVYGTLLKLTTDFEVALKFIATYGASKYVKVTGGQYPEGYEITESLNNLTPTMYFKVYGFGAPVDEIYDFIYTYMRDTYITDSTVYMSNICTAVEEKFKSTVRSIKYMGIDHYDGSYQEITYAKPQFTSRDIVTRYIPEQLNVTDIRIELDET